MIGLHCNFSSEEVLIAGVFDKHSHILLHCNFSSLDELCLEFLGDCYIFAGDYQNGPMSKQSGKRKECSRRGDFPQGSTSLVSLV